MILLHLTLYPLLCPEQEIICKIRDLDGFGTLLSNCGAIRNIELNLELKRERWRQITVQERGKKR